MKRDELKRLVGASGQQKKELAKKLHLTPCQFSRKLIGAYEFKVSEARTLADELGMGKRAAADVFFGDEGSEI